MTKADSRAEAFKVRDAGSYDDLTAEFDRFTARLSQPLAEHLVALAQLTPGERVLDIGTGTGVIALLAAGRVAPKGAVTGIDLSEGMLKAASEKASRAGLAPLAQFRHMDAEALEFADASFDAVLSLFALLHFPNPLTALKEMLRVLRPGGKLVLAIGSRPSLASRKGFAQGVHHWRNRGLVRQGKLLIAPGFLDSLVEKHLPRAQEPEESDLASRHHARTRNVLELVRSAGFGNIRTDWMGHEPAIENAEEFWDVQRTFSSIARKRLATASAEMVEAIRREFSDACAEVQARGGRLVYPFGAFFVVARRPGAGK